MSGRPPATATGGADLACERLPVRFAGAGAGSGEFSWGQREIWHEMREQDTWLPIGVALPLPAGTTIEDAVADLRFVMNSYPSMRTRLRFTPDGPEQIVAGSGETSLAVVDTAGDDPDRTATRVWRHYRDLDYHSETDWPLRMAVIRHGDQLTHRIWLMCHLVTDGGGGRVVVEELAGRDCAGSHASLPPLEQARWQRSPAGQRQSERALRHWDRVLRGVPPRQLPPGTATGPRYWQGRAESPAMHLATLVIAARTRVEVASVLLAVFTVAMARVTGANPVAVQLTVGNRFRPGLARSVSPLMQNGLCPITVPDGTVDEAVVSTRRQAMVAYKNAYYDPRRRDELIARVARERGEPVDLGCHFNDRRLKPRNDSGPVPTADRIRAALPESTFRWQYQQDEMVFKQLYVNVEDIPDRVMVTVTMDVRYASPDSVAACLHAMEEVAVAAALDPATRTGIAPPPSRDLGQLWPS